MLAASSTPAATSRPRRRPARAGTAASPAVVRVTSSRPSGRPIRRTTEQPGQIEAFEITPIHAKLAGYVESVAVDIGDKVKKGQVLAELRVPEVEADLEAEAGGGRAGRGRAEAGRGRRRGGRGRRRERRGEGRRRSRPASGGPRPTSPAGRSEFARVEQLVRERAQTGSLLDETRSKLQAAEAAARRSRPRSRSAEAALAEAKAVLDKARSDVDAAASHIEVARFEAERAEAMAGYARIVAPFDGVVTRRNVDTGHLTTPGAAGEPLFVVARSDIVTIAVGVPETDAPFVESRRPGPVRLQALEGRTFEGKVTRTAWALDPATRTLRAEIDLPNPDDVLRPGLYAYATIIAEEHKDVLTVPATAVVQEGGKSFCVAVADGRARRKEVELGLSDGKRTEVVSGLERRRGGRRGERRLARRRPARRANRAATGGDRSRRIDPIGTIRTPGRDRLDDIRFKPPNRPRSKIGAESSPRDGSGQGGPDETTERYEVRPGSSGRRSRSPLLGAADRSRSETSTPSAPRLPTVRGHAADARPSALTDDPAASRRPGDDRLREGDLGTPLVPGQVDPADRPARGPAARGGAATWTSPSPASGSAEALAELQQARVHLAARASTSGPNWIRHDGQAQVVEGQVRTISKSSLFLGGDRGGRLERHAARSRRAAPPRSRG